MLVGGVTFQWLKSFLVMVMLPGGLIFCPKLSPISALTQPFFFSFHFEQAVSTSIFFFMSLVRLHSPGAFNRTFCTTRKHMVFQRKFLRYSTSVTKAVCKCSRYNEWRVFFFFFFLAV